MITSAKRGIKATHFRIKRSALQADSFCPLTKRICERTGRRDEGRCAETAHGPSDSKAPFSPSVDAAENARHLTVMPLAVRVFFFAAALAATKACIQALDGWKDVGLEERAKRAPIVFHGLAIEATPDVDNADLYAVQFWMINIYKGADVVADLLKLDPGSGGVFNLRDRWVSFFSENFNFRFSLSGLTYLS